MEGLLGLDGGGGATSGTHPPFHAIAPARIDPVGSFNGFSLGFSCHLSLFLGPVPDDLILFSLPGLLSEQINNLVTELRPPRQLSGIQRSVIPFDLPGVWQPNSSCLMSNTNRDPECTVGGLLLHCANVSTLMMMDVDLRTNGGVKLECHLQEFYQVVPSVVGGSKAGGVVG